MRTPYSDYEKPIIMPNKAKYYIDKGPLVGMGGYSLLYSAHPEGGGNGNRFIIKEFFPAKGAKRNSVGKVVPERVCDPTFEEKRRLFEQEGEIGAIAGIASISSFN